MYPEYLLTKDGFTYVVMGFTGEKAAEFKLAYIKRFRLMELFIKSLLTARLEHPAFAAAVMGAYDEPKHYHFSNEADMINRLVLGVPAKKVREAKGLQPVESIRPFLTPEQIQRVVDLQRVDIGLLVANIDYDKRKQILYEYNNQKALAHGQNC